MAEQPSKSKRCTTAGSSYSAHDSLERTSQLVNSMGDLTSLKVLQEPHRELIASRKRDWDACSHWSHVYPSVWQSGYLVPSHFLSTRIDKVIVAVRRNMPGDVARTVTNSTDSPARPAGFFPGGSHKINLLCKQHAADTALLRTIQRTTIATVTNTP
jgi:hypothetical protein